MKLASSLFTLLALSHIVVAGPKSTAAHHRARLSTRTFASRTDLEFTGLKVSEVTFSHGIDGQKNPLPPRIDVGSVANRKPIYIWTKLTGDQAVINQLKAGALSVRHRWLFLGNQLAYKAGGEPDLEGADPEPLRAGTIRLSEGLQSEVSENEIFDWRTWSMKEKKLLPGWYCVQVGLKNGAVLKDENGKKYEYFVEIQLPGGS